MVAAANGNVEGLTGDETGIYAFDSYNVNQVGSGANRWNIGFNTLGLGLPAGERGTFRQILVNEIYRFGVGNFTAAPSEGQIYATIADGKWTPTNTAPAAGTGVYAKILRQKPFVEGNTDAFAGYYLQIFHTKYGGGNADEMLATAKAYTDEKLAMCKQEISDEISEIENTIPTIELIELEGNVSMFLLIAFAEAAKGTGSALHTVGATEGATEFQYFLNLFKEDKDYRVFWNLSAIADMTATTQNVTVARSPDGDVYCVSLIFGVYSEGAPNELICNIASIDDDNVAYSIVFRQSTAGVLSNEINLDGIENGNELVSEIFSLFTNGGGATTLEYVDNMFGAFENKNFVEFTVSYAGYIFKCPLTCVRDTGDGLLTQVSFTFLFDYMGVNRVTVFLLADSSNNLRVLVETLQQSGGV